MSSVLDTYHKYDKTNVLIGAFATGLIVSLVLMFVVLPILAATLPAFIIPYGIIVAAPVALGITFALIAAAGYLIKACYQTQFGHEKVTTLVSKTVKENVSSPSDIMGLLSDKRPPPIKVISMTEKYQALIDGGYEDDVPDLIVHALRFYENPSALFGAKPDAFEHARIHAWLDEKLADQAARQQAAQAQADEESDLTDDEDVELQQLRQRSPNAQAFDF